MAEIATLLGDYNAFLRRVLDGLVRLGVDVSKYQMDHVCFRVETLEQYEAAKLTLDRQGELLVESLVGGRPIATYKLREPLKIDDRKVWLIELPSPKKSSFYPTGLEHVEFVIDLPFNEFMAKYPQLEFDLDAINKPTNADIRIQLDSLTSVKFHHDTLENVIAKEKLETGAVAS